MSKKKEYTIEICCRERTRTKTGTLEELIEYFGYTLLKGHSWERERGNKRINTAPKSIRSLVTNLNNAEGNAAANGCGCTSYRLVENREGDQCEGK